MRQKQDICKPNMLFPKVAMQPKQHQIVLLNTVKQKTHL